MEEIVEEYIRYLAEIHDVDRPKMPKIALDAYTDSEYLSVIDSVNKDYESINDIHLTEQFLKGE